MRPHVFTWLPLPNLPQIPEHFLQRIISEARPEENPEEGLLIRRGIYSMEYKNRDVVFNGQVQKSRTQEQFFIGVDFEEWVKENIISEYTETSGRISVGGKEVELHAAHTDGPMYRLFYLVSEGGEGVQTKYYTAPNKPVLLAEDANSVESYNNMDVLTEINSTRFPVGQWVLHNGYVLHAVHGVTGNRVNVTVDIKPEHLDGIKSGPINIPV